MGYDMSSPSTSPVYAEMLRRGIELIMGGPNIGKIECDLRYMCQKFLGKTGRFCSSKELADWLGSYTC